VPRMDDQDASACSCRSASPHAAEARRHAEQAEVDAIAAHELAQTLERYALSARRNAERQARADTQAAERASRTAAELASADAHDRRIEAEGLAAAMRGTARKPRR
jgi:hypothetical protein